MLNVEVGNTTIQFEPVNEKCISRVVTLKTKEPETIAWIEAMPKGSVLWDVGANIGIYSLYAAALGHVVVAVEPCPANFTALQRNAAFNNLMEGAIYTVPFALDELRRTRRIAQGQAGASHLDWNDEGKEVEAYPLDDLVASGVLPAPTHIKIDTDGDDVKVLRGATATLPKVSSVIIETSTERPEDADNIARILKVFGFKKTGRHVCPQTPRSPIGMDHWHKEQPCR